MIIIKMQGGLGNQMFQVSLYTALKQMGKIVKLDVSALESYLKEHNWSSVFSVFHVDADFAASEEIEKLSDTKKNMTSKIRRKLCGKKHTHYCEPASGNYDKNIFALDDIYLDGYWQTEKYFLQCRNEIIKTFQFPSVFSDENKTFEEKINACECPVSVHIRGGDYLQGINQTVYGNICDEQYYDRAIRFFREKYPNSVFFVFSNDKAILEKYRGQEQYVLVSCNDEKTAWADMYLMSKCKHNIIANSSFSWWGAWLNPYGKKEVVAPVKWVNTKEMGDICPSAWGRM